jgi:hypothetical protein
MGARLMDLDGGLHRQQNKLQGPKSYFIDQIDNKLKLDWTKVYFIQKKKKKQHTHPKIKMHKFFEKVVINTGLVSIP